MRSILAKIIVLLFLFNCALWAFFIIFDDHVEREIESRKNKLILTSQLFSELVQPALDDASTSNFRKSRNIGDQLNNVRSLKKLNNSGLINNRKLRIYGADNLENLEANFLYYDGSDRGKHAQIMVSTLLDEQFQKNNTLPKLKFAERFFEIYKPVYDNRLLTKPIRTKNVRFNIQTEVLDSRGDAYSLRVLAPVKCLPGSDQLNSNCPEVAKTIGIIEIRDTFYIREAYVGRNETRLITLIGVSILTLLFGAILAISIAFPLRRLSMRLDQKLSPENISDQLDSFKLDSLARRKDEIGSLHKNLVTLTKQVSRLFKEKEQFAADVSHELKNPIASIIAHTENFQIGSTELSKEAIYKIRDQAFRMNTLVNEISEAAIVDHDLVIEKREQFDLSLLVSEIVEHYVETNEYPKLKIIFDGPKNLMMNGLPDRIGQVIVNLIENAISFTRPDGSIFVSISKKWRKAVTITVEDNGPGVRDELKDKIFERFFTSRQGSAKEENSSGLGLYICRQIIEAHGGEIQIKDCEGGGAAFQIKI